MGAPPPTLRCTGCGSETDLPGVYTGTGRFLLCPWCASRMPSGEVWVVAFLYASLAILAVAALAASRGKEGWLLAHGALFPVFLFLGLLAHEAGHALVAKALGLRVFALLLGIGRTVVKFRIGRTHVELRTYPMAGATTFAPREDRAVRLRVGLAIVAGPLANVAGIIVSLLLLAFEGGGPRDLLQRFAPWPLAAAANSFLLLFNLVPRKVSTPAGPVDSDGLALWRTLFMSAARKEELLAAHYGAEGGACLADRKWVEARDWYVRGLERHPDSLVLVNDLGVALVELGDFEGASGRFRRILDSNPPDVRMLAIAQNNLAWSLLNLGRPELLQEADRQSEEAFRHIGWIAMIKGTRGAVLVQAGRHAEGIELLRKAFEQNERPESKAVNAAWLALGMLGMGDRAGALQWSNSAKALDPSCRVLDRVDRRLGGS